MTSEKCINCKEIRNICILAHVDHGKTTIADSLIATNGHISKRSAGNARYLDDRRDEQERGITMKCSAISLQYDNSIVNLIDTPGHIDFSTEVSAAIRLCDGALIVVDVIEGVCVQTREALRHAFEERIQTILIINKLDRILVEQQKDVDDICQHILRIIEDCNAYVAELFQYDLHCTTAEEEYLFSPELGNVIFASAYDGWGVTTFQIAEMFAATLGETPHELNKKIWDFDCYVSKGKVVRGALIKKKPNLFISLFLSTINYVYFTLRVRLDRSKYPMIINKLQIAKENSDMKHSDCKIQVKAILQAWKPLAETIFQQVRAMIAPPTSLTLARCEYLVNKDIYYGDEDMRSIVDVAIDTLRNNAVKKTQTIVYVSKMYAVSKRALQEQRAINIIQGKKKGETKDESIHEDKTILDGPSEKIENDEEDSIEYGILALARVFSGVISKGDDIFVLSAKYEPPQLGSVDCDNEKALEEFLDNCEHIQRAKIEQLYVLLGRDLIAVDSVTAGHICGIKGLENFVARTGTLSSSIYTLPFIERNAMEPIVRNSIECRNPKELPLLRKGLAFLKKIDSCVQVVIQDTGELVLVTAGDVHLAKCIEDMESMVAKLDINVSKPMVALKETIISAKRLDFSRKTQFHVELRMDDIGLILSVIAVPLPENIVSVLSNNYEFLKMIVNHDKRSGNDTMKQYEGKQGGEVGLVHHNQQLVNKIREQLRNAFANAKGHWKGLDESVWAFSKMRDHCNVLINRSEYKRSIFHTLDETDVRANLDHCIVNGFEMCCRSGSICEEPITNCAFIVNEYRLDNYGAMQGMESKVQLVGNIPLAVRDTLKDALAKQMPRLMEPIFTTDIQVNTRILGKVYSVVNRRHGKVLDAVGMDDSEKTFLVRAQIPVAESHGFANEIRKTTSGQANPNLRFSHYEIIDGDPYYNFEESPEDDDDEDEINADASKRASQLRREIRKRKGLKIDDQVVVHAEKQRTLKK